MSFVSNFLGLPSRTSPERRGTKVPQPADRNTSLEAPGGVCSGDRDAGLNENHDSA
jgi:hypothetical protein